jgi:hypothetical protein
LNFCTIGILKEIYYNFCIFHFLNKIHLDKPYIYCLNNQCNQYHYTLHKSNFLIVNHLCTLHINLDLYTIDNLMKLYYCIDHTYCFYRNKTLICKQYNFKRFSMIHNFYHHKICKSNLDI